MTLAQRKRRTDAIMIWLSGQFIRSDQSTVAAWAKGMGLTKEAVHDLLLGKRPPTLEEERKLADDLGDVVHDVVNDPDPSLHLLSMITEDWAELTADAREKITSVYLVCRARQNKVVGV